MCPDQTPGSESVGETDNDHASTPRDEVEWLSAAESSDERVSFVDPLFYAPLLLVGTALVVIPEPATTALGVFCLVAGVVLATIDLLSLFGSE